MSRWLLMRSDRMPILNFGFSCVPRLPVLDNGIRGTGQPVEVIPQLLECGSGEELHAAGRRVSQRFEQSGTDKNGNVMRSKTKIPCRFIRNHSRGRHPYHAQKFFAFTVHLETHRHESKRMPVLGWFLFQRILQKPFDFRSRNEFVPHGC